jgi:hypothetical protein
MTGPGLQGSKAPMVFWLPLPAIAPWRSFISRRSNRGLSAPVLAGHAAALERSVLSWDFDAYNSGPFHLLDILALSKACGIACSADGKHYRGPVEEAQIQIMANMFAATMPADHAMQGRC